jgi:hypothetical protein
MTRLQWGESTLVRGAKAPNDLTPVSLIATKGGSLGTGSLQLTLEMGARKLTSVGAGFPRPFCPYLKGGRGIWNVEYPGKSLFFVKLDIA